MKPMKAARIDLFLRTDSQLLLVIFCVFQRVSSSSEWTSAVQSTRIRRSVPKPPCLTFEPSERRASAVGATVGDQHQQHEWYAWIRRASSLSARVDTRFVAAARSTGFRAQQRSPGTHHGWFGWVNAMIQVRSAKRQIASNRANLKT